MLGESQACLAIQKGRTSTRFSVLNLVMSNDGEGAFTLLLVAVIDHATWQPYGNASYYGGCNNPPEALRTVQRRKDIYTFNLSHLSFGGFIFYHIIKFNDGVFCLHEERIFNYSLNRSVVFLYILILTSAIPSFCLLGLVADEHVVYDDNKLLDTMWPSYCVNVRIQ